VTLNLPVILIKRHVLQTCGGMEAYLRKFLTFGTRWNCVVSFTPRPLYTASKCFGIHFVWGWVDIDFEPSGSKETKAQGRNLRTGTHKFAIGCLGRRVPHHRLSWGRSYHPCHYRHTNLHYCVYINSSQYRVIHKSLRKFRTRLRNNHERQGRKEHINWYRISQIFFCTRGLGVLVGSTARG